jgi:hypothetical protein
MPVSVKALFSHRQPPLRCKDQPRISGCADCYTNNSIKRICHEGWIDFRPTCGEI